MKSSFIYHIVVVGCGGTGGFFIKEFGRFMTRSNEYIIMSLIDGDTVEEHNLDRQCFQKEDIGLSKATVMGEALCSCLGIPDTRVYAYSTYIDNALQFRKIIDHSYVSFKNAGHISGTCIHLPIIIGAVDNHAARQVLHSYYMDTKGLVAFYFDSANEFSTGEVVFSGRQKELLLAPPRGILFPSVLAASEKSRSEMSCGELNVHEPQHIATNMMAANLLLSKTCSLIVEKTINLGVAMFDAFQPSVVFYPCSDRVTDGKEIERG